MFLDISNLVSSGETLTYISLLLIIITKNKDINNITILMNIIYEASILLLTISGEMLSMQKYCCYDTKHKNSCLVWILKLWFWIQEISLFQFSLTVFWVMKFLAMGSACKRYNDTTFSRIIWTAAVTHSDQISWNVCISFSLAWRWCTHPGCRIKSPIIILDIRNVIQRVVVYMQIIF